MFAALQQSEVVGQRTTAPQQQIQAHTQNTSQSIEVSSPSVSSSSSGKIPSMNSHNPLDTSQEPLTVVLNKKVTGMNINNTINISNDGKYRVMLCGTYPIGQSNGYSRVVYYIAKYLGIKEDIKLTIYGFQNYKQTAGMDQRSDIPSSVTLHDALATENPARNGFGDKEIAGYLRQNPQDMVIIFNDMVITTALTATIHTELTPEERKRFLLVSYMDQVYPYQKRQHIDLLNKYFDAVVAFTPYWRTVVRKLGLRKEIPCYVFPHGFDHNLYFPIPRKIARMYYNIPENAFVILQLNRNQPRKRIDHTIMAFAECVAKYYKLVKAEEQKPPSQQKKLRPLRLMMATMVNGFWDVMEILEHELRMRDVPVDFGKQCIIAVAKPQQLSDRDINILYNACDIGLNTCEGEGWGLCQSEHAAVGCPQVAPKVGGLQEFLSNNHAQLIDAKWSYYIDKQRDGIGGIAQVGSPNDYADAIWKYYTNPKLVDQHGQRSRKHILQNYRWETVVNHFHRVINNIKDTTKHNDMIYASN